MEFGELVEVDIQTIWDMETKFSGWLADNLNVLGDVLDVELELVQTEAPVYKFSADILAQELQENRKVIIENQFGVSNHDHLGKIVTYSAGYESYICVWIAEDFKAAHIKALEWLNERTDVKTMFFAFNIRVFRIDQSRPMYELRSVVKPNNWQGEIRRSTVKNPTPFQVKYLDFFTSLIEELRTKHNFTRAKAGQSQHYFNFASGVSGLRYGTSFAQNDRVRVELYIDRGDKKVNKSIFDIMMSQKEQYEKAYGMELTWERLDDGKSSRIAVYRPGKIDSTDDVLEEIKNWTIKNLLKFKEVFPLELLKNLLVQTEAMGNRISIE